MHLLFNPLRDIGSFRVKRPEIQKCSSLTPPNLLQIFKMLYIIINQETENFSSISVVFYEI